TTDNRFQFIQQFLGATDAEGRDKYCAAVRQGLLQRTLETLSPGAPVFVQSVAVGAFQHYFISAIGNGRRRQEGRMGRAEITREYDTPPPLLQGIAHIALHPSRTQDMPGPLEAYPQHQIIPTDNRDPLPIRGTAQ